MVKMSIISKGDRVSVYAGHDPSIGGSGVVTGHYVQVSDLEEGPGGPWQHVFKVRLDDGRTVDAPSRFVSAIGTTDN